MGTLLPESHYCYCLPQYRNDSTVDIVLQDGSFVTGRSCRRHRYRTLQPRLPGMHSVPVMSLADTCLVCSCWQVQISLRCRENRTGAGGWRIEEPAIRGSECYARSLEESIAQVCDWSAM